MANYVLTRVWSRFDQPQQGWIRKPTVNGTTTDFYEAVTDAPCWYPATQSFRTAEQTVKYGPRSGQIEGQIRQFYTDFPQQGWLYKPIVNGLTTDLYEPVTDYGCFPETQSFRTPHMQIGYGPERFGVQEFYTDFPEQGWLDKQAGTLWETWFWPGTSQEVQSKRLDPIVPLNFRDRAEVYHRLDQPSWVNPNIFDLDVRWGAIETGRAFSYRTPPDKQLGLVHQDWTLFGGILQGTSNQVASQWPAIGQLESYRSRPGPELDLWRADWGQFGWVNTPVDALLAQWSPAMESLLRTFRTGDRRKLELRAMEWHPQFGWVFLPVDAQVQSWGAAIRQLDSYRTADHRKLDVHGYEWSPEFGWVFTPVSADLSAQWPAVSQLASFRSPSGFLLNVRQYEWHPEFGWLFTPVTNDLSSQWPGIAELLSFRTVAGRMLDVQQCESMQPIIDTLGLFWPAVTVDSFRVRLPQPRRTLDIDALAWLEAVIGIAVFDASFWPAVDQLLRSGQMDRRVVVAWGRELGMEEGWLEFATETPPPPVVTVDAFWHHRYRRVSWR